MEIDLLLPIAGVDVPHGSVVVSAAGKAGRQFNIYPPFILFVLRRNSYFLTCLMR